MVECGVCSLRRQREQLFLFCFVFFCGGGISKCSVELDFSTLKTQNPSLLSECYITWTISSVIASSPCHWSVPSQQINTQKAQSRKKKAHIPPEYKMCTVCCLTIIQSCYFDYRINKPFALFSLRDLRFVLCSRDLDALRVQRIMGLLS